jgi:hypothetical protein
MARKHLPMSQSPDLFKIDHLAAGFSMPVHAIIESALGWAETARAQGHADLALAYEDQHRRALALSGEIARATQTAPAARPPVAPASAAATKLPAQQRPSPRLASVPPSPSPPAPPAPQAAIAAKTNASRGVSPPNPTPIDEAVRRATAGAPPSAPPPRISEPGRPQAQIDAEWAAIAARLNATIPASARASSRGGNQR